MNQVIQYHADSYLPTVSIDMKEVFSNQLYPTTSNPAASSNDSAAGGISALDAPPLQETTIETLNVTESDMESLFALLDSPKPSMIPSFSILPSKKERGKPYFINDEERILTTKRNEPIHLQLDACKPGQKILLTLRYSDQDYYDRPMVCNGCSHAYKGCSSSEDHYEANFCVKSRDGTVEYMRVQESAAYHPTAVFTVDVKHEFVDFWAAFKCRNSCSEHKKYGGDRTLRLELLNEHGQALCRNEWSLRVCESAKRDHNLFLSKAGLSRSGPASVVCAPRQQIAVPPPTSAAKHSAAQVLAADADLEPPPVKGMKVEEETVIHYIDDASSSTRQTGKGRTVFRCVPYPASTYKSYAGSDRKNGKNIVLPMSSSSSSGVGSVPGCFEAKPLLPIAPPAATVAEASAAAGVVPVMVYPKNEADKKLLVSFAERLGMDIYNVQS